MAKIFKFSILTPEKTFFTGEAEEINTISANGGIGILAEHTPFVGLLKPAVTKIKLSDGSIKNAFTSTGLLKVAEDEVQMVVDAAEWPEDIDVKRAEGAKERAEARLNNTDKVDVVRAEIALQRAVARIKTKGV